MLGTSTLGKSIFEYLNIRIDLILKRAGGRFDFLKGKWRTFCQGEQKWKEGERYDNNEVRG